MDNLKGRMLVIDWDENIVGLVKFPKSLGVKPEDFRLNMKERKGDLKLFEIYYADITELMMIRPIRGKVYAESKAEKKIEDYLKTDGFWLTELEAEDLKIHLGDVLPATLKGE